MELVLFVHFRHWDRNRGRFRSEAFHNSSDGSGISVVEHDWILRGPFGCVCNHAHGFYPTVSSEPPIFWRFDESILPSGYCLKQERSDSGDDCHHNIRGVSDNRARKLFVNLQQEGRIRLEICDLNAPRPLTSEDIDRLLASQSL